MWEVDSAEEVITDFPDGVFTDSHGKMHITQFGITWKFNQEYTWGQFANGDYWVVGPVMIIGIYPESKEISGRTKNGSMVNPYVDPDHWNSQGYDSSCTGLTYEAYLNVALNVSTSNPLVLSNGSSLISTISIDEASHWPQLKTAAVLTVLPGVPSANSFRPPYSGSDKTIRFNTSQLKYNLLKKLTPVSNTPSLETVERYIQRVWLDHIPGWACTRINPEDNMPIYGREMSTVVSIVALMLHLNFSDEEKETLLIRFVQLGIDNYGIVKYGSGHGNWSADGGIASGRKWPILFAGLLLGDTDIQSIGEKSGDYLYENGYGPGSDHAKDYIHFGEDDQTFYVTADDVALSSAVNTYNGVTYYGHYYPQNEVEYSEYEPGDIGLAEYGIRHATNPLLDGKTSIGETMAADGVDSNSWWSIRYRSVTGVAWGGFVLAARIMEADSQAVTLWNHNALFDYMDRYMAISADSSDYPDWRNSSTQFIDQSIGAIWGADPGWRQWSGFVENMWDEYRDNY